MEMCQEKTERQKSIPVSVFIVKKKNAKNMKTEVALVLCKNQRVTDNCVKCGKQSMCITIYLNLKKKMTGSKCRQNSL